MLSQAAIKRVWAPPCRGPWVEIGLHGAGRVTVRRSAYEAVKALDACLRAWNYRTRYADTGAYVCRQKVSGGGYSLHAYAIACDLNWSSNLYSRKLVTDMPRGMVNAICAIRTNNGKQVWNWGGFWSGTKDAMHYEVVCSPGDLATGIRWSTVPGAGAGMPHVPAPQPSQPAPPKEPVKVPLPPSASWETDMTGWVRHKNGTIARVTDDTFHPLTAIEWAADQFLYYQATGRQLDAARIGGMLWSLDDTSWNNFMAGRKYVPPIA